MATTMMLSDLRTAARQRADMVNSQFILDAELNSYINQSYFELYDLLVQNYGENYFIATPYTFTTDGTSEFYPLPVDFYKLAGLSVKVFGSVATYIPLRQGSFGDMQRLSGVNNQAVIGLNNLIYALNANNLWLAPIPQAGQTLRMFYVPRLTQLVLDTDIVDGVSGWTEYIICDAAIKCLQKEESDVSVLGMEKSALIKRIEDASSNRDISSPCTVSDTSMNFIGGSGWRNGWMP